jgi:hypothetical protein
MITYAEVLAKIVATLTGRLPGTEIDPEDHEDTEIIILDYIEQLKNQSTGSTLREAHASANAGVNCNLTWNLAFPDSFYSPVINGFDSLGNPVEIYFISKSTTKLVVKTLVNATLTAIAFPYPNPNQL